jgi:hypothetical protein
MTDLVLRKQGQILYAPDVIGKDAMESLKNGEYRVKITKPRGEPRPTEDMRSLAQNRLLHGWHEDQAKTTIEEFAGNTEKEWKDIMKYLILVDLYLAHNIKGYAEVINPMMRNYTPAQIQETKWGLVKNGWITTHDLDVQQFRLYLDKIEKFCMEKGILLRTDMGLYKMAMEQ